MRPSDAWNLTPSEYADIAAARQDYDTQRERQDWERARWIATVLSQPHSKKTLKYNSLIKFPWEKATATTRMTMQQARGISDEEWKAYIEKVKAVPFGKND